MVLKNWLVFGAYLQLPANSPSWSRLRSGTFGVGGELSLSTLRLRTSKISGVVSNGSRFRGLYCTDAYPIPSRSIGRSIVSIPMSGIPRTAYRYRTAFRRNWTTEFSTGVIASGHSWGSIVSRCGSATWDGRNV
ncbi:unnamed protein product [Tuber melanosporum]|uniref:(Perigord truffle) hypothetical protein n=1 Tax=Tuber melanosporum (strain Mel28) TaxID=656061 RepID=D5GHX2_TUBMM|nr:uncharacterized protein GSTUM_00008159001 [Tuber melanosporum]CAZ84115.1 unnamed protein product [Tuber melanosporum]